MNCLVGEPDFRAADGLVLGVFAQLDWSPFSGLPLAGPGTTMLNPLGLAGADGDSISGFSVSTFSSPVNAVVTAAGGGTVVFELELPPPPP